MMRSLTDKGKDFYITGFFEAEITGSRDLIFGPIRRRKLAEDAKMLLIELGIKKVRMFLVSRKIN